MIGIALCLMKAYYYWIEFKKVLAKNRKKTKLPKQPLDNKLFKDVLSPSLLLICLSPSHF